MHYTQVELTSPDDVKEVWWLPVPEGKAKVGERITRRGSGDWIITMVCTTLSQENIPTGARVASRFTRDSQTISFMTI